MAPPPPALARLQGSGARNSRHPPCAPRRLGTVEGAAQLLPLHKRSHAAPRVTGAVGAAASVVLWSRLLPMLPFSLSLLLQEGPMVILQFCAVALGSHGSRGFRAKMSAAELSDFHGAGASNRCGGFAVWGEITIERDYRLTGSLAIVRIAAVVELTSVLRQGGRAPSGVIGWGPDGASTLGGISLQRSGALHVSGVQIELGARSAPHAVINRFNQQQTTVT
ncbi:unnamed protein product [Lampetra planeri]